MIVADANLIIPLFLQGPQTPAVERVFSKDPVWAAPLLWKSEFTNVLLKYYRRKLLDFDKAIHMLEQAEKYFRKNVYEISHAKVLQRAADSECSTYDCEYVALAEDLLIPLVTFDQEILSAFPKVAVSPENFVK